LFDGFVTPDTSAVIGGFVISGGQLGIHLFSLFIFGDYRDIVAVCGHAGKYRRFSVPFVMARIARVAEMGCMGKRDSSPFWLNLVGRLNDNVAHWNTHAFLGFPGDDQTETEYRKYSNPYHQQITFIHPYPP
jgi:hypothetical protein